MTYHLRELIKQVTIKETEAKHMVTIGNVQVPFGYMNHQWQRLLNEMKDGDEIWEFGSNEQSWKMLAGRAGIALVRDGKFVMEVLTRMS